MQFPHETVAGHLGQDRRRHDRALTCVAADPGLCRARQIAWQRIAIYPCHAAIRATGRLHHGLQRAPHPEHRRVIDVDAIDFLAYHPLGGLGLKRQDFSFDDDGVSTNPLPSDKTDLAVHAGVGADLMFGRFGIMAEVTDYITRNEDSTFGQHDAFGMVGLRVRM